jgi:hypothetical protein
MSEVIAHLAEPWTEEIGATPEEFEKIIRLTITAWNLTLLPMASHKNIHSIATEVFRTKCGGETSHLTGDEIDFICEFCDEIKARKQKYYPNLKNFIIDVWFEPRMDQVYFEVMYAKRSN